MLRKNYKTSGPTATLDAGSKRWAERASIGERLKWLLDYRGMKQTELAAKIGRTQASISNVVTHSSRRPNAETLLRMAAALQCSAEWLVTGEGQPFEVNVVSMKPEKELLEAFRCMDVQAQSALLAVAQALANKPVRFSR